MKVKRNLARNMSQKGQKIFILAPPLENVAKGLNEPGPGSGVPPGVKSRDGAVHDQKVRVSRDLVGQSGRGVGLRDRLKPDAPVQLVALASLNEKQLRLSRQRRASLSIELRPQPVRFVGVIASV